MNTPLDVSAFSALFPDFNDVVIISGDGEITRKDRGVAAEFTQQQRYLICHRKWSEARLQAELPKAGCAGTVCLCSACSVLSSHTCWFGCEAGPSVPVSPEDKTLTLFHAAQKLIDELAGQPDKVKQKLARLADMMGRGGWQWTAR